MTTAHDKPKRWRPRFSVRKLVIVVTLVCCYAACWGPTKTRGIEDVRQLVSREWTATVIVDFDDYVEAIEGSEARDRDLSTLHPDVVITTPNKGFDTVATVPFVVGITSQRTRCFYFWFFGYVAKLPYEREVPIDLSRIRMFIREQKEEVSGPRWNDL